MTLPTYADVAAAAERIRGQVHRTPVLTSATLDAQLGAQVFFKCENLQKVGAFKARGATNAVLALDDATAVRGVVTHSSGNHGAALAYAARQRRIPAVVVMPDDAPRVKINAVQGYGAEIVLCPRPERDATAERIVLERGATMIHPFEHPHVIAGQGTAALELFAAVPDLDVILAPVGGGGLISGTALVARQVRSRCTVLGVEPDTVDDAARSIRDGVRYPGVKNPKTLADGLMTGLGEAAFAILRATEASVVTVAEGSLAGAARFFLERMKIVVEPSAATVLAALWAEPARFRGRRIGAILSGGNTDLAWLREA
jgi:threonine dehydratase